MFTRFHRTNVTHRQTDKRMPHNSIGHAMHVVASKNTPNYSLELQYRKSCKMINFTAGLITQRRTKKPALPKGVESDASTRPPDLFLASCDLGCSCDLWPPDLQSRSFHALAPWTTCTYFHINCFIRFQNTAFTRFQNTAFKVWKQMKWFGKQHTIFAGVANDSVQVSRAVTTSTVCFHCNSKRLKDAEIPIWHDIVPRFRVLNIGNMLHSVLEVHSLIGNNILEVRTILLYLWHRLQHHSISTPLPATPVSMYS